MKTLLLQVATSEIECYAKYSKKINDFYTKKHNYDYKSINSVSKNRHQAWGKVKAVINNLVNYDRIFMLDADAYINNDTISLDKFSSDKIINICRNDENGGELLNTGSIIFLNDPLTFDLLNTWYDAGENTDKLFGYFWEQSIFNSLHNDGINCPIDNRFKDNVEVFESRAFNSWWLDVSNNYNPNQFIQHIMARSNKEKIDIIKRFYDDKFKLEAPM